jgi:hypothetical protein
MVELGGHLATNAGVAICGAAVAVFPTSVNATQSTSVDCATTTTTTSSGGDWAVSCLAANTYDVRITCGSSVRWRRYVEEIQVTTYQLGDDGTAYFGAGNDAGIRWSDGDASNHALVVAVGDTSQQIHITDLTAIGTDWNRSAGTHPELAIHSNTTPITDYLAIGNHDGTTASINVVGGTTLSFAIAGNTEASITASGLTLPANSDLLFTGGTGTNDIVLTNALADALSITDGSADVVVIDTSTSGNVITLTSALTVGVDDTGHDVKFFGAAAGAFMLYDQSCNLLDIRGATAAGPGHLKLTTGELTVVACDVLGRIDFQAPLEADCSADARLVGATIAAVAQGTFGDAVNATDLIFYTGHSETAAEKFRFTSQNEIGVAGANYGTDGQVLTSGGAGAAVAWEDAGGGGTTINNATANELVTIGATTTELCAEANLLFDGNKLFLGDSLNANVTIGFTLNQSCNDDQILALKSACDVVTAITTIGFPFDFETDDYANFGKVVGAQGGLVINGMTEGKIGVQLNGWMATHCAAKSTSATAPVMLQATRFGCDGTVGNSFYDFETGGGAGCSNVLVIWQKDASYDRARFIFDVLGNFHADNGSGTFDAYCDAALSRTLDLNSGGTIENQFDQFINYNEQTLIDTKILGGPIKCGGMLNVTGLQRLHNGAIWQLHTQMLTQREEIDSLKTQMQALSEGK